MSREATIQAIGDVILTLLEVSGREFVKCIDRKTPKGTMIEVVSRPIRAK